MLVYLKEPMGYTSIEDKRVYGKRYSYGAMGPTNISIEMYKKNKDILIETEYDKHWLENKYGGIFPDISFKVSELSKLSFDTLATIAQLIGIEYIKTRGRPSRPQRAALRRCVANKLNKAT